MMDIAGCISFLLVLIMACIAGLLHIAISNAIRSRPPKRIEVTTISYIKFPVDRLR